MKLKLNILIADDSPTLREVIKRQIEKILFEKKIDAEFYVAGNGAEAELILQESLLSDNFVDLIFLDWMMPEMSGFEFLQKIRSISLYRDVPDVIMLTAETYSEQINACLKYNVTAYVIKPFVQKNLQDALEIVLEKRQFKHAI